MLNSMVGADPRDLSSLPTVETDYLAGLDQGIQGLRVAWSPDWGYAAVDPEVRQIAAAARNGLPISAARWRRRILGSPTRLRPIRSGPPPAVQQRGGPLARSA